MKKAAESLIFNILFQHSKFNIQDSKSVSYGCKVGKELLSRVVEMESSIKLNLVIPDQVIWKMKSTLEFGTWDLQLGTCNVNFGPSILESVWNLDRSLPNIIHQQVLIRVPLSN